MEIISSKGKILNSLRYVPNYLSLLIQLFKATCHMPHVIMCSNSNFEGANNNIALLFSLLTPFFVIVKDGFHEL